MTQNTVERAAALDFVDDVLTEIRKARLLQLKVKDGLERLVGADDARGALIAALEGVEWVTLNDITGDVLDAAQRRCKAFAREIEGNEGDEGH